MAYVNEVCLLGNLGANPELRYTQQGLPIAYFRMATSKVSKGKEYCTWHRIVAYGKLAELVRDYLQKGSQIHVRGELRNREWDDKDGKRHWMVEVAAQSIQFLRNIRSQENTTESE